MNYKSLLSILFVICFGCSQKVIINIPTTKLVGKITTNQISQNNNIDDPEYDDIDDDYMDHEQDNTRNISDPLYYWNKLMFHFNDKLYFYVLKPTTKVYKKITTLFIRKSIKNFFHNIKTPIRFVSYILQGNGKGAESEFIEFFCNTTVGFLGFGTPAQKYLKLKSNNEDMGQTLGKYGIGNGFYIIWPILGPSTLRDSIGMICDDFLDPITYVDNIYTKSGLYSVETINSTSFRLGDYEALKEASLEPYEALRDAYIQHREKLIKE